MNSFACLLACVPRFVVELLQHERKQTAKDPSITVMVYNNDKNNNKIIIIVGMVCKLKEGRKMRACT